MKFLNWSKGLTVKEKILLHLLNFNQYANLSDVPENVTQQGIASAIYAPRPHVSIALKDLRSQKLIFEKMTHIIHGKRRQKVYFLTPTGLQFINNLNQRLKETIIKVRTSAGEKQQKINEVCIDQKISLIELLLRISTEGILDLTQRPVLKSAPGKATDRDLSTKVKSLKTTTETPFTTQHTKSRLEADLSRLDQKDYTYTDQYYQTYQPRTSPSTYMGDYQTAGEKYYKDYYDYWNQYYQYYYQPAPIFQISEKGHKILFGFGYILLIIGTISGIYFFALGNLLIIIPLILFLTFGISIILFSGTWLWQFEVWRKQILNLMSLTCPVILYLFLYSAIQTKVNLYDLGLWLIIMISFFGLAYFGTFIPLHNRVKALSVIGLVLIINVPMIFLFNYIDIFQSGFWLMIGFLCVYLGYTVIIDQENYKDLYMGIIVGTSLGIITASLITILLLDVQSLTGLKLSIVGILILWLITGAYLFAHGISKSGVKAELILTTLKLAIPLYVGIFLIFFGLYLFQFEKIIETLIEFFLGGIIIFYTLTKFKIQQKIDFATIGLTSLSLILSLAYLYIF